MITTASTESSNLKAEYNLGYVWLISVVAALGGMNILPTYLPKKQMVDGFASIRIVLGIREMQIILWLGRFQTI